MTRPTRVPEEKKPVTPATKGPADTSDSPPIRPHKELPTKRAYSSSTQPPRALKPALTPHEKGKQSRVATSSAATPDRGEGNQVRIALSCNTSFPTPSTARPGDSLAPTPAPPTSPTGNSKDQEREHLGEAPLRTLPPALLTPTSPTDNPGYSRRQSANFRLHRTGFLDRHLVPQQYRLHGPGFQDEPNHPPPSTGRQASRRRTVIQSPGRGNTRPSAATDYQAHTEVPETTMTTPSVNLEALANLQADELRNIIESLQGMAASRTEGAPTPTTPQHPPTPTTAVGEEEAILWEQVGTCPVPLPDRPPTSPPPHQRADT